MNYESDKYRIATWQVESVKATFEPNQYLNSTGFVINGGDVNITFAGTLLSNLTIK